MFSHCKVLFLNIILRVNFTREAEIVTLTRNNCQLPGLFISLKIWHKNTKIVFFFTSLIHWLVYATVIIHLSVGEKPSIFTSTSVTNCSLTERKTEILEIRRSKMFAIARKAILCCIRKKVGNKGRVII